MSPLGGSLAFTIDHHHLKQHRCVWIASRNTRSIITAKGFCKTRKIIGDMRVRTLPSTKYILFAPYFFCLNFCRRNSFCGKILRFATYCSFCEKITIICYIRGSLALTPHLINIILGKLSPNVKNIFWANLSFMNE